LHLDGRTPDFLAAGQVAELMETFNRHFHFAPEKRRDFSIEFDPCRVETSDIEALAFMGFNRANLGVQDFDPAVQRAVTSIQGVEETLAVIESCRRNKFRSVIVNLIYGLPAQTPEIFGHTLDALVSARPDRVAIHAYARLPHMFRAEQQYPGSPLPSPEAKLGMLQLVFERLAAAGYHHLGMAHFALPGDELSLAQAGGSLRSNFMGYTTHDDTDLIGVGVGAISHVGDSFSQNQRNSRSWKAAIDSGRLPTWRGLRLDADDVLRSELIQQLMCNGAIDKSALEARFGISFDEYFSAELGRLPPLVADGLLEIEPKSIRASSRGRLLLRIIAACFDRYLHELPTEPVRCSTAI
jgi:oxygen-independent coproporphyrinogen-3 oxidase